MKSLILILSLAAVNCQVIINGQCPDVEVVQNFNLEQYTGIWYEVYRYEQPFQFSGDCVQANYTLPGDGTLGVRNSMVSNEIFYAIDGYAVASPDAVNGEAKYLVTFPVSNRPGDYWVLATDYTHHSLVYSCHNLPNNNKEVSSWILSRTKNLSPQSVVALNSYIDGDIGLYWNMYRETSQSEASCYINPNPTTTTPVTTTPSSTTSGSTTSN